MAHANISVRVIATLELMLEATDRDDEREALGVALDALRKRGPNA